MGMLKKKTEFERCYLKIKKAHEVIRGQVAKMERSALEVFKERYHLANNSVVDYRGSQFLVCSVKVAAGGSCDSFAVREVHGYPLGEWFAWQKRISSASDDVGEWIQKDLDRVGRLYEKSTDPEELRMLNDYIQYLGEQDTELMEEEDNEPRRCIMDPHRYQVIVRGVWNEETKQVDNLEPLEVLASLTWYFLLSDKEKSSLTKKVFRGGKTLPLEKGLVTEEEEDE